MCGSELLNWRKNDASLGFLKCEMSHHALKIIILFVQLYVNINRIYNQAKRKCQAIIAKNIVA